MSLAVFAPPPGTRTALGKVPERVFAAQMVGSGTAVEPARDAGCVDVAAPVAGTVTAMHPHAFVIRIGSGAAVLVHLGIETVRLNGEEFRAHVADGEQVKVGQNVITFDAGAIRARGLSAICPVVVLDSPPGSAQAPSVTGPVRAGALLFSWATS
ncbi:PTS glucose transporter subunit IIA [Streptomyces massasporeus]